MSADTADLIAFVRAAKGQVSNGMALDLAAALEAAEARANEEHERNRQWLFEDESWRARAEAAEAQRDTLAEALRASDGYLRTLLGSHAETDQVADVLLRQNAAALAAVEPPEEQP